jgi:hypothetical protein
MEIEKIEGEVLLIGTTFTTCGFNQSFTSLIPVINVEMEMVSSVRRGRMALSMIEPLIRGSSPDIDDDLRFKFPRHPATRSLPVRWSGRSSWLFLRNS